MRRLIHHPDASLLYDATTEEEGLKNTAKNVSPVTSCSYKKLAATIFRKMQVQGCVP
jgi:hypothetical protein